MRTILSICLILCCLFLYSCQSMPTTTELSSSVIQQYAASEVVITKGQEFNIGSGLFLKDERAFLAEQLIDSLRDQLPGELRFSLLGKKPAKVKLEMNTVSIATSSGRQLNGDGSLIRGKMIITDLETGHVVGQTELQATDIGAQNGTVINGVPVGAIVSFVENSNSGGKTVIIKARDSFLREIRSWLK